MASLQKGSHKKEPIYRSADGDDPTRSRQRIGCGSCQETRHQRADDLHLAQTLRRHGCRRCEAAASNGTRECPAEEAARRARSRNRSDEGDRHKKMVGAPARRQQVEYAKGRGLSERRACALLSVARSALHYESKLREKDASVLAAMAILSAQYPRYWLSAHPGLLGTARTPNKCGSRLATVAPGRAPGAPQTPSQADSGVSPTAVAPQAARKVWAYDFVFDSCANGQ